MTASPLTRTVDPVSAATTGNQGVLHGRECRVAIGFPTTPAADDATLVSAIANLVNVVFIEAETGIWRAGFQRTDESEVAGMIRRGQLALAYLDHPSSSSPASSSSSSSQPIGCVCIKRHSDTLCSFSMLTLDAAHQGNGLGRELVKFAENHCLAMGCSTMGLELLVPTLFEHALKTRMQAWYSRLGYRVVKLGSFAEEYPSLAPLLAGPADYRIFEKKLR